MRGLAQNGWRRTKLSPLSPRTATFPGSQNSTPRGAALAAGDVREAETCPYMVWPASSGTAHLLPSYSFSPSLLLSLLLLPRLGYRERADCRLEGPRSLSLCLSLCSSSPTLSVARHRQCLPTLEDPYTACDSQLQSSVYCTYEVPMTIPFSCMYVSVCACIHRAVALYRLTVHMQFSSV